MLQIQEVAEVFIVCYMGTDQAVICTKTLGILVIANM